MEIKNLKELRDVLTGFSEEKYKKFSSSLIPTVEEGRVLGVRLPTLRRIAASFTDKAKVELFHSLPHKYLEEDHIHSFLISKIKDYGECIKELDRFLPYVDNWAVCDSLRPTVFKNARAAFLSAIDGWLSSSHAYTVRFGIEMLMIHFLGENFDPSITERVAGISSEDYYVNMMIAWFFAEALTKRWEEAIGYLEVKRLSPWVHNKCISKCIDSYRISSEQKAFLRELRIKQK